jgi:hypothetical protein
MAIICQIIAINGGNYWGNLTPIIVAITQKKLHLSEL